MARYDLNPMKGRGEKKRKERKGQSFIPSTNPHSSLGNPAELCPILGCLLARLGQHGGERRDEKARKDALPSSLVSSPMSTFTPKSGCRMACRAGLAAPLYETMHFLQVCTVIVVYVTMVVLSPTQQQAVCSKSNE